MESSETHRIKRLARRKRQRPLLKGILLEESIKRSRGRGFIDSITGIEFPEGTRYKKVVLRDKQSGKTRIVKVALP